MRCEDWTLRKAEVRLAEHGELRNALGLRKAPDHTALYRFMRRLDEQTFLLDALNETVRRILFGRLVSPESAPSTAGPVFMR